MVRNDSACKYMAMVTSGDDGSAVWNINVMDYSASLRPPGYEKETRD